MLVVWFVGFAVAAEPEATIEAALQACLGKPEGQSTVGMIACTTTATEAWDTELNRVYGALMSELDADGQKKLKAAQRAWIAFRDLDRAQLGAEAVQLDGTLYRLNAASEGMALTRERALQLGRRLAWLEP